MRSQKELIDKKDWTVMIILDACRYDYFEEVYDDYLSGELKKVESEGTWTGNWLKRTFDGVWSDVAYVSGTAMVNNTNKERFGFRPKDTFPNIIDAWKKVCENEWMLMKPSALGRITRRTRARHPGKRIIAHFMQPHGPYRKNPDRPNKKSDNEKEKAGIEGLENLKFLLQDFIVKVMGYSKAKLFRDVCQELGICDKGNIEEISEKFGNSTLRYFYRDNLKWVLSEVQNLIRRLPDKNIIVTSDHGECLGEENEYGHNRYYDHPIIKNVPWLEVKRVRNDER